MDPSKNPIESPTKDKEPPKLDNPTRKGSFAPEMTTRNEEPDALSFSQMIEEVISPRQEESNRFNMSLLHEQDPTPDPRRFDERDYQSHRRESFPHTHHPLKPLHSRSMRKKHVATPTRTIDTGDIDMSDGGSVSPFKLPSSPQNLLTSQSATIMGYEREEDEDGMDEPFESCPLLEYEFSYMGGLGITETDNQKQGPSQRVDFVEPESSSKKVQFEVGGSPLSQVSGAVDEDNVLLDKKKHKTHRSQQKYEDPQWRRRQGSEMMDSSAPHMHMSMRDGDTTLPDMDKDDLTSHRFGDTKGFRRHRFFPKGADDPAQGSSKSSKYDHQPHEIFVELDILSGSGENREWKEAARWIKYEEDVEEGADRWGRPHVASLSFHSLINVRRLVETGVCLFDMEERDLPGVAYRVVEQMVVDELIRAEEKGMVMRSLLLKHKHVNENEGLWRFNLRRNTNSGSLVSLHAAMEDKSKKAASSVPSAGSDGLLTRRNSTTGTSSRLSGSEGVGNGTGNGTGNGHVIQHADGTILPLSPSGQHIAVDLSKLSITNLSEEGVKWISNKEGILRRIPVGSEASIVLVGKEDLLDQPTMAFVRLAESVYMPNITEVPIPVRFIFILLGPSSLDMDYKEIGRSISTLMSNRHFHELAYKALDRKHLLNGMHEFLDESIVLPPGDWDNELFPFQELKEAGIAIRKRIEKRRSIAAKGAPMSVTDGDQPPDPDEFDPMIRTNTPFGGLINEVKKRYPLYLSDIKDGLNFQSCATVIFIYFAAVSGAIAFGGILGEKTEKRIGISETLVSTAAAGILFALFAGQPLIILGTTAPLLLFDESLYQFTKQGEIDFLAFRFWIGVWVALIGILFTLFEMSVVARLFTRFTQEIFASLISLLFISETVSSLVKIYMNHPVQKTYESYKVEESLDPGRLIALPNTALLSTAMCLGTFIIAYGCRMLRNSKYFTEMIRKFLGNFAVPLAIFVMVFCDYLLRDHATTDKLSVPKGLTNTQPRNPEWFVRPDKVSVGIAFAAVIPALLVFILIFMETSICGLIVGKKEQKLRKGSGFHIDILLVCIINAGIGSIGGAWVCAATVRAVTHASALTVFSTNNPPGQKPSVLGVLEQRLTSLLVSVLVGLSVLMSPALELIPLSVLFGVFLYMGISSMSGIQFFSRVTLLLKQVQNHPQVPFVRRVRTSKMHLFTMIQLLCLGSLWAIKSSPAALGFPFLLILLVPLNMYVLKCIFKPSEIAALDAQGIDPERKEGSPEPELSEVRIQPVEDMDYEKDLNGSAAVNGKKKQPYRFT